MFPNGAALQILCQRLDLCTKSLMRVGFGATLRYKTNSACKSLILKALLHGSFLAAAFQALDFSGCVRLHRQAINKVIHSRGLIPINCF